MMNSQSKIVSHLRIARVFACVLAATLVATISINQVEAASGDLDTSFGNGGFVTTDLGDVEGAETVAIQSDGRIVIGVKRWHISASDFIIMRYNTDGTVDTSFGIGGVVQTQFLGLGGNVSSVKIDSKGRIVAAGTINIDSPPVPYVPHSDFALARYKPNGALDTSFGSQGKIIRDYGGYDDGREMVIQQDGRIVVAGWTVGDFAVFRLTANGAPDLTFAGGNVVLTDFQDNNDFVHAMALQSDGRIVVGGESCTSIDNTTNFISSDFVLARYNPNGTLDTTFGGDGKVTTPISDTFETCFALLIHSMPFGGEQIIAVGTSSNYSSLSSPDDFVVVCYLSNGSLNSSFGAGGMVFTDFSGRHDGAHCVVQQPDGKIVVAGQSSYSFALARYNDNGTLDRSFGNDGKIITQIGVAPIKALALTPQAEIIAVGRAHTGATREDIAIAKYLP
jgi:uncharacterized delta-60 repeat protein